LTKVFDHYNNPESSLFVELLTTLTEIKNNSTIKPDARFEAIGFIEGLCKYETILTANIYLLIYQKTTPLSKYLQGYGVNIMTSYQMVKATLEDLKINVLDFSSIKKVTDTFVE